jgi:hypothetical protein
MSNPDRHLATPSDIITPEEYEANRRQLAHARQVLEQMEAENALKLKTWHELQQRVADGERARWVGSPRSDAQVISKY